MEKGKVGVLDRIIEDSAQAIFEIKDGYIEILLPVIDEFIKEVNREEKKIVVSFPDGLLELYRDGEVENDEE